MSGYTTGQRRYIESVDGRAHQQAVEIIGASERERDEAHAEIERLREVHLRGCECSVTEACQLLRERDAAVALLRECRPAVEWAREFCIDRMDSERRDTWEAVLDRLDAFLAGGR